MLKIGVFLEKFEAMPNWQRRLLLGMLQDSDLDLTLITFEGDKSYNSCDTLEGGGLNRLKTNFFAKLLVRLQNGVETRFFFKEPSSISPETLESQLRSINAIHVAPMVQEDHWVLNDFDLGKVQGLGLDLIIQLTGQLFQGKLLSSARFGMWYFLFRDPESPFNGPVGFWEVQAKHQAVGFALLRLNTENAPHHVLDTAFFNRDWSMTETRFSVAEGAVSVFFKNLGKLKQGLNLAPAPNIVFTAATTAIGVFDVLKYMFGFYGHVVKKIASKILDKFFGIRGERWTLFTAKGDILKDFPASSKPIPVPKNEFWADPFLFNYLGSDYVFFEKYCYNKHKGSIACGVLVGDTLTNVIDIMEMDAHMSYPYIFEDGGSVYLMPETSENQKLEIYKATDFPTKWQLFTTAFEGEAVADAFFYTDQKDQKWLFVNKQAASTSRLNSELFIYKTDSIDLKNLVPHAQNPVIIDARTARNGGEIFEFEGHIYRPSQRNVDGIYGRALNINKIEKLTLEEYEEVTVKVFYPDFDPKLMAMHHVHQKNGHYVFDAAYKRK